MERYNDVAAEKLLRHHKQDVNRVDYDSGEVFQDVSDRTEYDYYVER